MSTPEDSSETDAERQFKKSLALLRREVVIEATNEVIASNRHEIIKRARAKLIAKGLSLPEIGDLDV